MNYYNLKIALMLKHEMKYEETYSKISNFIAYAMLQDKELKEKHKKNEYKNYVFCGLYPVEKDQTYKTDKIYTFDLRSIDVKFVLKIKQLISIVNSEDFKIIMSNLENSNQRRINTLLTLTPAIITRNGNYLINDDLNFVKKRILDNTQKKYKNIFNKELDVDFIENIEQVNIKPIKISYKNIFMLGNKFKIDIKQDEDSQNLAYINLAVGLLEKNAQGFGFCKAK